ncbi:hypothetical protein [Stenotrophomonas sp. NRRL B-14846]|uniref:hypothetical protein n=1 Tax=Stenotrophomonas sp. NRRL B-14846 TaxID=3162882 RepID=UPI003D2B87F5
MHGPATFRSTSICLVLAALALSSLPAMAGQPAVKRMVPPPSLVQAYRAAEASLRRIPGDDIESDFRPVWTGVADLDGDGRAEVVYFLHVHLHRWQLRAKQCRGGDDGADGERSARQENPKSLSPVEAEDYAAIRRYGYGDDAAEQIPGAIRAIRIQGDRIIVDFTVTAGATVCEWMSPNRHVCPPEGHYTWTLRWTPGKLARIKK